MGRIATIPAETHTAMLDHAVIDLSAHLSVSVPKEESA
jgi:hypothetical protein